jgi:Glycosyltransferase family 29 (sialyltransferase)
MKIFLIGNAPVETDLSEEINSADLVVRFNRPDLHNFNINTGVKTDALCITNLSAPGRGFAKFKQLKDLPFIPNLQEIWFPRPAQNQALQMWLKPWSRSVFRKTDYSKFIIARNGLEKKRIVYFGDQLFSDCCSILDIDDDFSIHEPSSGFLALQYIMRNFDPIAHQLMVTGFTFRGVDVHPWEKEKMEFIKLANSGKLKMIK